MEVEGGGEVGGEMALPINSAYGLEHGHMINHEPSQYNHIVTSSAAAIVECVHHHQQLPFTNGTTMTVPPTSSMEESVIVAYNNSNRMMVRYRECLKNHAAAIGGNATDGCGEFMPSGEEGTLEALTCSACNCHRNFHRKEVGGEAHHQHNYQLSCDYNFHSAPSHLTRFGHGNGRNVIFQGHHHRGSLGTDSFGYNHNNAGVLVPSRAPAAPMIVSYNMGLGSLQSESDEQEDGGGHGHGHGFMSRHPYPQAHQMVKKRFRTKFTQEQKEKMLCFAEKVGWKIQKQEETVVQQFCQELGIKRRVLKVWMHNNKHNLAKNINSIPINPPNQII